ncbi:hypothetical protein McpSp1_02630 [Methanocorpusculaceae archaeon Sp1]|nr:hypothetical protein [Methanocorpusculaceae archaeon Sp1]
MKRRWVLLCAIIIVCIIVCSIFAVYHLPPSPEPRPANISDEMRETLDVLQGFMVEKTKEINTDMRQASFALSGVTDEKEAVDILYELYWEHPEGPGIYRTNAAGEIITTVPYTIMTDALNNPELRAINEKSFSFETDLILEGPVYTQSYGMVLCFMMPVYTEDGKYDGYICLGQSPDEILLDHLSPYTANSTERYDISIIRPDGTILWHPNTDLIGKNIYTSHLFDEFRDDILPLVEKPEGETSYRYRVLGYDQTVLEKDAVWKTVMVDDTAYRVVLATYHYAEPEVVFPTNMTDMHLQNIVRSMYLYAGSHTKDQTLAAINDPKGPFAEKGVIMFAYNMDGTLLAHSTLQYLVGEKRLGYRGAYSILTPVTGMINRASQGGGFTHYYTAVPYTDHLATFDLCYVLPVDDTWFVGAAMPVNNTLFPYDTGVRDDMHKNLETARKYLNKYGKEKTIEEMMDQSGFFHTNNISVFAGDYNGTMLTDADILPIKAGENSFSMISYHGGSVGRELVILAKSGGGYTLHDTNEGIYMIYVEPVDDTWYMGSSLRVSGSHPLT